MKKYLAMLLALLLVLTAGCGAPAAGAREAASGTGSYDLFEKDTVDDSMSFRWYWQAGKKELPRYIEEDILPQYVEMWFHSGELLDVSLYDTQNGVIYGWALIGGEPKRDMGWNSLERQGQTVYCRRIRVVHQPHSQDYVLEKTGASPALRAPEPVRDTDIRYYPIDECGLQLPRIKSAELYVNSLKTCFILKDPQKLEVLRSALSLPPQVRMQTFMAGNPGLMGQGNPLVLEIEGQGKSMVMTDARGGPVTDIWAGHVLLMPMSLFDLFGVPLEAEGYSFDRDGNTQLTVQGKNDWQDWDYLLTLDPRGNLTGFDDRTPYPDVDPHGKTEVSFVYDGENRMTSSVWGRELRKFTYNDRGLLEEMEVRYGEGEAQRTRYEYDDQGRKTVSCQVDGQGREIPGSGQYIWYDEEGQPHGYWFAANGEPMGDPPAAPVRRPAR